MVGKAGRGMILRRYPLKIYGSGGEDGNGNGIGDGMEWEDFDVLDLMMRCRRFCF
jgi:hypothetical protein